MSEQRARRRTGRSAESAYSRAQAENKRALYHCSYCHRDVSNEVRIKCADCAEFDLCLDCFAVGVEVTPHRNTHRYRVMDNLSFPLLHPDWGADEELLLLEGIDIYGFGNWAAVSEHVGTKGKDACREHYFATYVDVPTFPLPSPAPEMTLDVRKLAAEARASGGRKRQRLDPQQLQAANADNPGQQKAAAAAAAAAASDAGGSKQKRLKSGGSNKKNQHKQQQQQQQQQGDAAAAAPAPAPATPAASEGAAVAAAAAAGAAAPKHKTFVAPAAAAPAAAPGATPGTLGLGLPGARPGAAGGWDITGWHAKRGEFDFEYDQDAEMAIAEMEFKEDDSPLDVAHKLKMLEIYNKRLDERERRRDFILEHGLLNVRRMQGLETRRLPHEREQYAQMRVFARYLPPGTLDSLVEGLLAENRLRARIAELQAYRRAGLRTFGEVDELELERPAKSKAAQAAADDAASTAAGAALAAHAARAAPTARAAAQALGAWRTRRGVALDICGLPGTEALSARERELCASARILPAHYLSLKDVIMRDAEANGFISRQDARTYFRMDTSRALRLYDLMLGAGWLGDVPPHLLSGSAPGARLYRQILGLISDPGAGGEGGADGEEEEEGEEGEGEEEEGEEAAGGTEAAAPVAVAAAPTPARRRSARGEGS